MSNPTLPETELNRVRAPHGQELIQFVSPIDVPGITVDGDPISGGGAVDELLVGGDLTGAMSSPALVDMGRSYGNHSPGAPGNAKVRLYWDGENPESTYSLGISSALMEVRAAINGALAFFIDDAEAIRITNDKRLKFSTVPVTSEDDTSAFLVLDPATNEVHKVARGDFYRGAYHVGDGLSGTVTLLRANGPVQWCSLSGNATIGIGIGDGVRGDAITLLLDWVSGGTLDFDGPIRMPAAASALLPLTLAAWRAYRITFQHFGGGWQLLDFSPDLPENTD